MYGPLQQQFPKNEMTNNQSTLKPVSTQSLITIPSRLRRDNFPGITLSSFGNHSFIFFLTVTLPVEASSSSEPPLHSSRRLACLNAAAATRRKNEEGEVFRLLLNSVRNKNCFRLTNWQTSRLLQCRYCLSVFVLPNGRHQLKDLCATWKGH